MAKNKVVKSKAFVRSYKKYVRKLKSKQFAEASRRLILFESNWQASELETHKLKHAHDKWAFTILKDSNRDDRVVFVFKLQEKEKVIWLLGIGPHNLVYREL